MAWAIPSVTGDHPPLTPSTLVETLIRWGEQTTRHRYGLSPRRLGLLRDACGVPRWIVCAVQCKVMLYLYHHQGCATHLDLIRQYPGVYRQSLWIACQLLHQRGYLVRTKEPPPEKGRQRILYRVSPLAQSVFATWKMQDPVWLTQAFFDTVVAPLPTGKAPHEAGV